MATEFAQHSEEQHSNPKTSLALKPGSGAAATLLRRCPASWPRLPIPTAFTGSGWGSVGDHGGTRGSGMSDTTRLPGLPGGHYFSEPTYRSFCYVGSEIFLPQTCSVQFL